MKMERMLAAVIVLQVLILISQWTGQPSASIARADQITNPGERQLAILEESKATNAKLEKILSYLQSGDMTVKVAKDDKK
jgi:hypothetical protein